MKNIAKKNQLIITTLAIMIAVAGFLNYSGKGNIGKEKDAESVNSAVAEASGESVDTADLSEEDIYVQAQSAIAKTEETAEETLAEDYPEVIESLDNDPADDTAQAQPQENAEDAAAANADDIVAEGAQSVPGEAVLASSGTVASIANLKLTREQTRSQNKEALMEIVNSTTLSDEQKQSAVNEITNLTQIAEKEAAAEILLQAKGFSDVVVNMDNDMVDVIVNVASLDDVARAQIEDIVKRKTGVPGENIVITTLNESK